MVATLAGNTNPAVPASPSRADSCTFVSALTSTAKPEKNAVRTVSANVINTGVEEATTSDSTSNQDNCFVDVDRSANVDLSS